MFEDTMNTVMTFHVNGITINKFNEHCSSHNFGSIELRI